MSTLTLDKPKPCLHREITPARACESCGAYLTSRIVNTFHDTISHFRPADSTANGGFTSVPSGEQPSTELERYEQAIVFCEGGTLLGEPAWAIHRAEDAGIIYLCEVEDGSCGHGKHWSATESVFWHLCEGKRDADYDAVAS